MAGRYKLGEYDSSEPETLNMALSVLVVGSHLVANARIENRQLNVLHVSSEGEDVGPDRTFLMIAQNSDCPKTFFFFWRNDISPTHATRNGTIPKPVPYISSTRRYADAYNTRPYFQKIHFPRIRTKPTSTSMSVCLAHAHACPYVVCRQYGGGLGPPLGLDSLLSNKIHTFGYDQKGKGNS